MTPLDDYLRRYVATKGMTANYVVGDARDAITGLAGDDAIIEQMARAVDDAIGGGVGYEGCWRALGAGCVAGSRRTTMSGRCARCHYKVRLLADGRCGKHWLYGWKTREVCKGSYGPPRDYTGKTFPVRLVGSGRDG